MKWIRPLHHLRASLRWAVALCLSTCLLACTAASYEDVGRSTAKGLVVGTYEGVQKLPGDKLGHALFSEIAQDPSVRKAAHDLAESAVLGAGDGVTKASLDSRVEALVAAILTIARRQGEKGVDEIIDREGPKLKGMVRETLSASLRDTSSLLRTQAKGDLGDLTRALVTTAVSSFAEATRGQDGAAEALGLAGEKTAEGAVRGLRTELAKPETVDAVGALSHRVASELAGGLHDSLVKDLGGGSAFTAWMIAAIVGLTLLAICGGALLLVSRRYALANRALALVADRINQGGSADLKRSIKDKAETAKLQEFLSGFLVERGL